MRQGSQYQYLVEDINKYMQLDRTIIRPCNAKFTFFDFCTHSHNAIVPNCIQLLQNIGFCISLT